MATLHLRPRCKAACAGLLLCCGLALSGCAGMDAFAVLGPKVPDVPAVPAGQYPDINAGAPTPNRPAVLDAAGQTKMQGQLEALGKQTQDRGAAAAAADQP